MMTIFNSAFNSNAFYWPCDQVPPILVVAFVLHKPCCIINDKHRCNCLTKPLHDADYN